VLLGPVPDQVDEPPPADEPRAAIQHLRELRLVEPRLTRGAHEPLDKRPRPAVLVELPGRIEVLLRPGLALALELAGAAHGVDATRLGAQLRGQPRCREGAFGHDTILLVQNRFVRIRRSSSSRPPGVRRIVVATDRSESADRAVAWAVDMAERYGAELVVVQVVESSTAAIEAELARFAEASGARGRVVTDSDPSGAIVRAAAEEKADVLVVGNVGMSGRREFLLGNVPNRVSHNAPCTVVIVNTSSGGRRCRAASATRAGPGSG